METAQIVQRKKRIKKSSATWLELFLFLKALQLNSCHLVVQTFTIILFVEFFAL